MLCALAPAAFGQYDEMFATEKDVPEPRSGSEVEAVLAKVPGVDDKMRARKLNIVLVADEMDHGSHEHGYPLWQKRWQLLLGGKNSGSEAKQLNLFGPPVKVDADEIDAGTPNVTVTTAWKWPSKEQFKTADLVAVFCYGHWTGERVADVKGLLERGAGFVAMHPCCIVDEGTGLEEEVTELIGLVWKHGYTGYRHGHMDLKITAPDHPICKGLPPSIHFLDEAYFPLVGDLDKVTVIGTSDEKVSEDGDAIKPETMFWTYKYGKGRVYGCILGHYNWTFDDPYLRILLLRGMAWAAGESPYRFDHLVLRGVPLRDNP
jgi:type 1 glutamine amidotransferase